MYGFDKSEYDTATEEMINFFNGIPKESLFFRPNLEDAWSNQEHIIHFIDCEIAVFVRLKTILADSGITMYENIEDNWTKRIDYHKENVNDYIAVMRVIRKMACHLFMNVIDEQYEGNYVMHVKYGKIDLPTWVKWYTSYHFRFHKNLIERNLTLWRKNDGKH